MLKKVITSKDKTKCLVQYAKEFKIRDSLTLGIVFKMWSELEVLQKGVFLDDLTYITGEPLLIIGYDEQKAPTLLTYHGNEYRDLHTIFTLIQSCDKYYVFVVFPKNKFPDWYLNICEPNPYVKAVPFIKKLFDELEKEKVFKEEFKKVYKDALMVLINGALKQRDEKQFLTLVKEWKNIA